MKCVLNGRVCLVCLLVISIVLANSLAIREEESKDGMGAFRFNHPGPNQKGRHHPSSDGHHHHHHNNLRRRFGGADRPSEYNQNEEPQRFRRPHPPQPPQFNDFTSHPDVDSFSSNEEKKVNQESNDITESSIDRVYDKEDDRNTTGLGNLESNQKSEVNKVLNTTQNNNTFGYDNFTGAETTNVSDAIIPLQSANTDNVVETQVERPLTNDEETSSDDGISSDDDTPSN